MTKLEMKKQARELRKQGWSIKAIEKTLAVSRSSVSIWVRDINLSEDQQILLAEKQRQLGNHNKGAQCTRELAKYKRQEYQNEGREKANLGSLLHTKGCMLYWAVGAKNRNRVDFVNSDPHMMQLFVQFLRVEFEVLDTEIIARIHCHTSDGKEQNRIEKYWSELLKLPISQFGKTQVKQKSSSRRNRLANGICGVRVHRTAIIQHIYGAIQEYGGFDNPDWLF